MSSMINAPFNMGQPWPHAKRWLSLGRPGWSPESAKQPFGLLLKPTLRSTLYCGCVLEQACERDQTSTPGSNPGGASNFH